MLEKRTEIEIWSIFKAEAKRRGYVNKVVGDNAYINNKGEIFKLVSAKNDKILVYEEGIGRYEIS
jgi:hypothetical protein